MMTVVTPEPAPKVTGSKLLPGQRVRVEPAAADRTSAAGPASPGLPDSAPRAALEFYVRLAGSIALVIIAWLTVRPLGLTGTVGLVTWLLVINSVFLIACRLRAARFRIPSERVAIALWVVAAAALLALRSESFAPSFAFFAAGYAGFRLPGRWALRLAALAGVLSAVGLKLAESNSIHGWPWLLGLTVALPVFMGMSNRSRETAVISALAAANAGRRAAESEARAQTLAERARISRDVHDVLADSLSGVSMQLELTELLLQRGDVEQAQRAIGRAHSLVREGMTEAQRAVQASRAEVLPLRETLESLFRPTISLEVTGPVRELPTAVSQTLIRAAQESLTNARKHAGGARVEAALDYGGAGVRLEVSNGPVGTPAMDISSTGLDATGKSPPGAHPARSPAPVAGSGMGLVGMRERAALLGGRMDAEPILLGPLAGGWRVLVQLPVAVNPLEPGRGPAAAADGRSPNPA